MAVKIWLRRMGAKKRPFYRLVVADARSPRDGRFIEAIGVYDPLADPAMVRIDADRVKEWMSKGARPTDIARQLLVAEGILEAPKRSFPAAEKKPKLNKKALARQAAAEAAPPAAPEEAPAAADEAPAAVDEAPVAGEEAPPAATEEAPAAVEEAPAAGAAPEEPAPVDEAPAAEPAPVEETPAAEPPVEEAPAVEMPSEPAPVVEEAPATEEGA